MFGGQAWSRATPDSGTTDTEWYLHLFSAGQPDWNWRNPAVGDYFEGVLRFWFDKGVDGLRIDVAHALFKADGLPDAASATAVVDGLRSNPLVSDQEEVHEVYRRWRTLAEKYQPHRLLVGEVNLEPARAARYTRADEMHQAFAFAFVKLGWDPAAWAEVGTELEAARQLHGAAPSWALENHDIVRSVTRFGGSEAAASWVSAGPGPPCWHCSDSPARPTFTRARNSACPRWTFRWKPGWTPCGPAAASPATAPASRCPGPRTRR